MAVPSPSGRVVVTGIGGVTPLGTGLQNFWPRLVAGESAVGPITLFDAKDHATRIAAEVKDFNPEDWLDRKEARRVDRFIAFAVAAAQMALDDSKFPEDQEIRDECGVLIGSGIGGLTFLGEQFRRLMEGGPSRISPFLVPYMIPDMASGYVSIQHKFKGPNTCVVTACATGANSIGDAYHIVKRGDAIAMLAGGSEAPINEISVGGFAAAKAMTTNNDNPSGASRPFDLNRDGFVIGEGSAVVVLEDYAFAKARGARIYGEIVGYGMTGDAFHITQPDADAYGSSRSMSKALKGAGLTPEDVDYINAHGTSTPYNDRLETLAIKKVFGDYAGKVLVSSTKSMVGHLLGAAGAIESVVCLMTLNEGIVPPTINYETPDPDCDLDVVPNVARKADVKVALSNSFGFGGHNASLAFRRVV